MLTFLFADGKEGPEKKITDTFLGDKKIASLCILGKALIQQGRLHGVDTDYGIIQYELDFYSIGAREDTADDRRKRI